MKGLPDFKSLYKRYIVPQYRNLLKLNAVQIPSIKKIIVHRSLGIKLTDKKTLEKALNELQQITGQKPILTYAKKSVSTFRVRKNMPIGMKVTLRSKRMFTFLEKLYHVIFPQVPNYKGLGLSSFDEQGNLNIGIKNQKCFPELTNIDSNDSNGLDISIHIHATHASSRRLLELFGFFFFDDL
uniref:Ribosomal protein L5 n=3 Tax=Chromera velia TaxID=505693 RepID=D9IXF3_9ALVE|nr:ribosomal protein L5 [Chromera velia]ADJ66561.1 ribosomal protein L5 [Chromera velia]